MEQKLRAPDTIEDAIVQAKALLGDAPIARALDVSASLVGKWSNHDDPAHRIGCHQALTIDLLLIESGHVPVFAALFERQRPAPMVVEERQDPVQLAMRATTDAAVLMEDVAIAASRGEVAPAAAILLRDEISKVQADLGKLRRALARHAPTVEEAAAKAAAPSKAAPSKAARSKSGIAKRRRLVERLVNRRR